jgi:hypothetical protein
MSDIAIFRQLPRERGCSLFQERDLQRWIFNIAVLEVLVTWRAETGHLAYFVRRIQPIFSRSRPMTDQFRLPSFSCYKKFSCRNAQQNLAKGRYPMCVRQLRKCKRPRFACCQVSHKAFYLVQPGRTLNVDVNRKTFSWRVVAVQQNGVGTLRKQTLATLSHGKQFTRPLSLSGDIAQ